MIPRLVKSEVEFALRNEAAVALLGPRQVGKTTLALEITRDRSAVYLDLESRADLEKLDDAESFLRLHADKLVVLDEVHRAPELFNCLRGLIDEGRREGRGRGRFLLLGSAGIDLLRQSETLAGRIAYIELEPLLALETAAKTSLETHWLRGGFPRSLLAEDNAQSLTRRENFIRSYLERDVPMFGPRLPAATLGRLWTMLAHSQGGLLNQAQLARNLDLSSRTIVGYIDLLADLLLLRRLAPLRANIGKRLVKSPKIYVRDSGLLHALLGIEGLDGLLGHPVVGASWEGFVIENLLAAAPSRTLASFYRTARGAEIDLVLEMGGGRGVWAIEIKRSQAAATSKGFAVALDDLQPDRAFVVHGGKDRFPRRNNIEAISLPELAREL
ncbi:MAG: ATP-binding protein, partial [Gammaproteobacteria bacterium]|nr:ATP-binding protein [Gammaproteobacteria bacterium]